MVEYLAAEQIANAPLAGVLGGGSMLQRMATAAVAAENAGRTAVVLSGLHAVSTTTAVVGCGCNRIFNRCPLKWRCASRLSYVSGRALIDMRKTFKILAIAFILLAIMSVAIELAVYTGQASLGFVGAALGHSCFFCINYL